MKIIQYLLFFSIISLSISSHTQGQIYLGVGGGMAYIQQNNIEFLKQNYSMEGRSFTRKMVLGYQTKYFDIEFGHRLLGTLRQSTDVYVLNSDKKGWEMSLKGKYGFGKITTYGKAGMLFISNRNNYTLTYNYNKTYRQKSNSQDLIYGVGVDYALMKRINIRVEYESIIQQNISNYGIVSLGTILNISPKKMED